MRILDTWEMTQASFVKVMPTDYKRVLEERRMQEETIQLPRAEAPTSLFPTTTLQ
jgi:glutamate synthase domain-containing protein 3